MKNINKKDKKKVIIKRHDLTSDDYDMLNEKEKSWKFDVDNRDEEEIDYDLDLKDNKKIKE